MNEVKRSIESKLQAEFQPVHLDVQNESHMHSVPPGSESHFKVVIVSPLFQSRRQVQRHQAIYACLAQELQQGVHALALHSFSPEEWQAKAEVPTSPECLGGSKHDHP